MQHWHKHHNLHVWTHRCWHSEYADTKKTKVGTFISFFFKHVNHIFLIHIQNRYAITANNKNMTERRLKQISRSRLCCPFFDSVRLHIGALVPVMPTSLDCVQGERDCLMLLPQFHLSVALTKAFDCQNPDSLDSNPLLFKCCFLLLIFFEALSKHDSALHSKAAFLSSCTNTGQFWIVPC